MFLGSRVALAARRAAVAPRRSLVCAILAVCAALLASGLVPDAIAEEVRVTSDGQSYTCEYTADFAVGDITFGKTQGYDTVALPECGFLTQAGWPRLPVASIRIALPPGMRLTAARVLGSTPVQVAGEYNLLPAQPMRRISDPPQAFVGPQPGISDSKEPYPAGLIQSWRQGDLAGQGIATVEICPLQYIGAERRLVLHTQIRVVLEGTGGYVCGDYLPAVLSESSRTSREQLVRDMVVNPEDVQLTAVAVDGEERGVGPGDYEYVVITDSAWTSAFQPLVNWKIKKGLTATIVTTSWIYNSGGYSGSNPEKIHSFVVDAYAVWGSRYFLLGGDTNIVPPGVRTFIEDAIPNDTYYGDFDQDWICEAHVGRAPARSLSDVNTFVSKSLAYQRTPPGNFADWAAFFGFDLSSYGAGEGEYCKQDIAGMYLPGSWTLNTEYDSQPGGHYADTLARLNYGYNLFNHIDHASTDVMGAGSINHGTYLDTADMSGLTNGARQGILYSIGCYACDYDSTTCIAEGFVRNASGGGVAFVGNSRYGWYVPGSSDGASSHYDRLFFRSLFNHGQYRLGDCFSDHKNDSYEGDEYSQYIFTELTLLGDPELPIWTAPPAALSVTHPSSLSVGLFTDFPVHVSSSGDPIADATVCLWKNGDVYQLAQTDAAGAAGFWFFPATVGNLQVTVTKHNCVPYEAQVQVIQPSGPFVLTVVLLGQGTVEVDPPEGPYSPGAIVQVTAQPAADWCFDHWETALSGSDNPATLVMDSNEVVTAVFAPDCNHNGLPDAQDIASGAAADCNENGVPDECDIGAGTSADCQPNGIPDECELAPPTYVEAADSCAEARIVCPPTIYYGTTVGATSDGAASCGNSGGAPDVWYYYEPYGNGYLTISLCGSAYDTVVSVHTGCPGTSANQIGCNNDYCGLQSQLSVVVFDSHPYWIRVSGAAGAAGDFRMVLVGPSCRYDDTDLDHDGLLDECEGGPCGLSADANCDGAVNAFDIDPFVLALTNPSQWLATYDCNLLCACDCNGDGVVNAFDIDAFVAILTGGR